jgi:hypothetical protein
VATNRKKAKAYTLADSFFRLTTAHGSGGFDLAHTPMSYQKEDSCIVVSHELSEISLALISKALWTACDLPKRIGQLVLLPSLIGGHGQVPISRNEGLASRKQPLIGYMHPFGASPWNAGSPKFNQENLSVDQHD